MKRREFGATLGGAVTWPLAARAYRTPTMPKVADAFGITLLSHDVRDQARFAHSTDSIATERNNAMIVDSDLLLVSYRHSIVEFAAAHRLPAMYGPRDF